ncbi:hypothetical protein F4818DRAFT_223084 [Hypoxylon cercidicola]|nr:hypothetical protein F4818DRAFT_223084 [Hypoxylon cercidicola]
MKGLCSPLVLLVAVLGRLGGGSWADGHSLVRRGANIPGPENFVRHRYPTVVAFDDYLYIDGGELLQQVNGTETNSTQLSQSYSSYALNSTLSLGLNESWTNETAEFRSIQKTAPLLDQQIYWTDTRINTFYTWGGKAVGSATPPANELWLFNGDGTGGGAWSQVPQGDFRDFSRLRRPVGSSFTQTAHAGYALGGQVTSETDSSIQKANPGYALPGLVSYDFQTSQWTNISTVGYQGSGYGTNLNGRAEYIPFGPNGLLLFFGGAETPVDATDESIVQLLWNMLWLYDPVTGKWYNQMTTTTGGIPRPPQMERACSVGVEGPNNTYEIFIYGGTSDQLGVITSDVYVLSLPGFVFFRANSAGTPRADHACVVVGKGKRQMLSYGGVDGGSGLRSSTTTPDPWRQGLGIFDMTEMRWTDSYDPNAINYEPPADVNSWYVRGGMDKVVWSSDEVKQLFVNGTITYGGNSNSSSTENSDDSRSGRRIGGIVGGTVGGVIVLTAACAGTFVLLRRRRRRQSAVSEEISEYRPEPWPKDTPRLRSTTPGTMMTLEPTPIEPVEISGIARGELPGEDVDWAYELPVPTPRMRPELPDRKYTF